MDRFGGAWRLGPLLGLVFLAFPVGTALAAEPDAARTVLAVGGAALFSGVFLWLMWTQRPLGPPALASTVGKRRVAIAGLGLLVVSLNVLLGVEWRVLFFHTNVAAGILLLRRDAYVAVAVLAVANLALGVTAGMAWLVLPTVALGLWATAFTSQLTTVVELRAAREELARLAVGEERLRFARDLHDLLGHSLSLITLKHELAIRLLPADPARAATEIGEAQEVARQALRDVREAVAGYRQPTLADELFGAEELLAAAGVACQIDNRAGLLPKSVEGVLAWAVREGVTNVIRHSRARLCTIRLEGDSEGTDAVSVEVRDDGRGSTPTSTDRSSTGSGLAGLAERVARFEGAEFTAGPLPEGGFRLSVRVPGIDRVGSELVSLP